MSLDNVMVALDCDNTDRVYRLVDEIGDLVRWYKIGPVLFTRYGDEVIQFLHRRSKRIFLDLKLYDTPRVVADTVKQIAEFGVELTTVHCLGGREMLDKASLACRHSHLQILGVTLLTSQTAIEFMGISPAESDTELVVRLVDRALEARVGGVVCSPHELGAIRKRVPASFLLVTAGIRPRNERVFDDDQKRIASPVEALSNGADFIVIGRPLLNAPEPRTVLQKLFSS